MTTTQTQKPKALQFADRQAMCATAWIEGSEPHQFRLDTAAELRRQHAEIARLTAELERQRAARIEAQVDNEELKAKLARSGLECHKAVREAVSEAVAAERMACMVVCDQLQAPKSYTTDEQSLWDVATMACTDAIRARGTP